mmetsp:Transcript_3534/g.7833  ORF Transcript_3534/g.7833 Transcript_3534/m.7833 type:complete len:205 (-) Transcript_3534:2941-3555(-)
MCLCKRYNLVLLALVLGRRRALELAARASRGRAAAVALTGLLGSLRRLCFLIVVVSRTLYFDTHDPVAANAILGGLRKLRSIALNSVLLKVELLNHLVLERRHLLEGSSTLLCLLGRHGRREGLEHLALADLALQVQSRAHTSVLVELLFGLALLDIVEHRAELTNRLVEEGKQLRAGHVVFATKIIDILVLQTHAEKESTLQE